MIAVAIITIITIVSLSVVLVPYSVDEVRADG